MKAISPFSFNVKYGVQLSSRSISKRMETKLKLMKCNRTKFHTTHSFLNSSFGYISNTQFWSISGIVTSLGLLAISSNLQAENTEEEEGLENIAGERKDGLPTFSRAEVAQHKSKESRIWVIYRNGVYDITDFIELHPGQEKILLAAGSSIEPFWSIYRQHLIPEILSMLEEYRIGNLELTDIDKDSNVTTDPFSMEPERLDTHLTVRSRKPFNAETPPESLGENFITPNHLFFVRNHLPVPMVDPKTYHLEIAVAGHDPIYLSLEELKTKFPKVDVMAAIQCAGNRRNDMTKAKEVKGGFWDIGAIGNAVWSGASLKQVLTYAGLDPNEASLEHVQFVGLDHDFEKSYGASIPLSKALDPNGDVILAYEMNGEELPLDHGYPVRVVAPGIIGARNVKWVYKILATKEESPSHWQQKDYKGFSPNVDWHNVDWNSAPAIQEYPVQSAITYPKEGAVLKDITDVTVKGFAWSGGGRGIIRVDVSIDGGKNWHTAELQKPPQKYNKVWSWSLWNVTIPLPKDAVAEMEISCKAVDSSYNTQPEHTEPIWNLRGVLSNAWHKVHVTLPPKN